MVPSSHKTLLVACLVTACLLPWIQSLSIPPTPRVQGFRGTIPSGRDLADAVIASTTTTAIPTEDANNGRDDDSLDGTLQNKDVPAKEQSEEGMRKDLEQERDTKAVSSSSPTKLSPEASSSSTDDDDDNDTDQLDTTSTTITDDIDTSGTESPLLEKSQPVFEVIDIVLRPFRPPTVMVLDFFRKPKPTGSNSAENDDNSKPISSSSDEIGSENNESSAMASADDAVKGIGKSSHDNSEEKKENHNVLAGMKMGEDKKDQLNSTPPSNLMRKAPNGDSPSGTGSRNKVERKKRETNQMSNNSNMGDDESSEKGKFQHDSDSMTTTKTTTTSSSISSTKNSDDDTPINADINGDDDTDDDDTASTNNGQNKTDGNKSGTVKIFLEILQLVPLSISNTSTSSSSSLSGMGGESSQSPSVTSTTTTVISTTPKEESAEANPNQKFSPADPSTQTTSSGRNGKTEQKRVARSVTNSAGTGAVAAEQKSNPSASALPSSETTD